MRHHPVATRREAAAVELLGQHRHGAGDGLQRLAAPTRIGQRAQQRAGIRMLGIGEEVLRIGHLDDLAGVHQRHAMRHARDDSQVVRDQQQAQALLLLQLLEQVQHLRLDRDVQRGGGFVGDEEVGFGRQRHRDHHALLLAAAHAERVLVEAALGLGDADPAQPLDRLGARRRAPKRRMRLDGLDDLDADLHDRVQAGGRLLEDHADATAAHGTHAGLRQREQIFLVQAHVAAGDAAVLRQQPHQRERRHALAAAGFADERERLAALDGQAEAVDGLHQSEFGVERHLEVVGLEHMVFAMARAACGRVRPT
jgi:hypothetical protein